MSARSCLPRAVAFVAATAVVLSAGALSAVAAPSDEGQWYIDTYGIGAFHDEGIDGTGVTIAVIDMGIYPDLPTLAGASIGVHEPALQYQFPELCPDAPSDAPPAATDDFEFASHGTNVVAMIVGNGEGYGGQPGIQGVAPGAHILFYGIGSLDDCTGGAANAAIKFAIGDAVAKGADIISISLGGVGISGGDDTFAKALHEDIVILAAIDNANEATGDGGMASRNGIVSVGAFGPDGNVDTGPSGTFDTSYVVDVVAPGVSVLLQGNAGDWTSQSLGIGTSFATPITAANIALAMQKYPNATPNQILQSLIRNTESQPHELQYDADRHFGYGRVDTISLLAADPTQYGDVNPFIVEGDVYPNGPTADQIRAGCADELPGQCDPPPSPSPVVSSSAAPGSASAAGGMSPIVLPLAALGLVLLTVTAILVIAASRRKAKG